MSNNIRSALLQKILFDGINVGQLRSEDILIALIGPSGSGKSFLTSLLSGQKGDANPSLQVVKTGYQETRVDHPKFGKRIVIIEAPQNSESLEYGLGELSKSLKSKHGPKAKLTALLHLCHISNPPSIPAGGVTLMSRLQGLLGDGDDKDKPLSRLLMVATATHELIPSSRDARFEKITTYWKNMTEKGSTVHRQERSSDRLALSEQTWALIIPLIETREASLLDQEIMSLHDTMYKTEAEKKIWDELESMSFTQMELLTKLYADEPQRKLEEVAQLLRTIIHGGPIPRSFNKILREFFAKWKWERPTPEFNDSKSIASTNSDFQYTPPPSPEGFREPMLPYHPLHGLIEDLRTDWDEVVGDKILVRLGGAQYVQWEIASQQILIKETLTKFLGSGLNSDLMVYQPISMDEEGSSGESGTPWHFMVSGITQDEYNRATTTKIIASRDCTLFIVPYDYPNPTFLFTLRYLSFPTTAKGHKSVGDLVKAKMRKKILESSDLDSVFDSELLLDKDSEKVKKSLCEEIEVSGSIIDRVHYWYIYSKATSSYKDFDSYTKLTRELKKHIRIIHNQFGRGIPVLDQTFCTFCKSSDHFNSDLCPYPSVPGWIVSGSDELKSSKSIN